MLWAQGPLRAVAFDATGHHMVTVGADCMIKVWDVRNFKPMHAYRSPATPTWLDISQRGMLAVGHGRRVQVGFDPPPLLEVLHSPLSGWLSWGLSIGCIAIYIAVSSVVLGLPWRQKATRLRAPARWIGLHALSQPATSRTSWKCASHVLTNGPGLKYVCTFSSGAVLEEVRPTLVVCVNPSHKRQCRLRRCGRMPSNSER